MHRTIPKKKTLDKWTNQWEWLKIENKKLVCSICTKYTEKLPIFLAATNAFINGSNNYRTPALKDYSISKIHKQACVEWNTKRKRKRWEICSKANENYHTQILSSHARFQSNERRQGKRLDQIIWNCLSYCTKRKAIYQLFQPRGVGKITGRKISWKIRKPSWLSKFYFCYRRLVFFRAHQFHWHFKWRNNRCSYNWTRSTICCYVHYMLKTLLNFFEGCGAGKSRCTRFKKCYLILLKK